ncbi:hypothetical protein [Methylobacterium oxalidis]|uniref:hypothetical protein n=1 Tax=Methylobacterium oxalidis TaxID=944322 RepID=UPI0033157880
MTRIEPHSNQQTPPAGQAALAPTREGAVTAIGAALSAAFGTASTRIEAPALAEPKPQALVERAERLIRLGDISGARLVLERAMDRGEPRAVFLLAQTCDPRMLRAWKVQGLQPDPERARALYARAAREGLADPKSLAEAMR